MEIHSNRAATGILKMLSLEDLIEVANDHLEFKKAEIFIINVLRWKIEAKGNVIRDLCKLGHERVASHFMEAYSNYSDVEFFKECLDEERSHFVKHALKD